MQVGKISTTYYSPAFERKLRDNEKLEYKHDTIRQAYDFLGVKDVAMVVHGSCFPVAKNDMGVGSPFNSVSKDLIEMEQLHGFNATQLGPLGEISREDISPYASTVWAKNKLFIDTNALATDEYANILDTKTLAQYAVPYNERNNAYEYSKFYEAFENYDILMEKAHENFLVKVKLKDPDALRLNEEYSEFKKTKGQRVMKEALFEILKGIYGTGNFEKWENPIDRNLPELLDDRNLDAIDRYKFLMNRNGKDVGIYCFTQFLIDKQMAAHKAYRKNKGFEYIADQLVGTSKLEEYVYQNAFLKNYKMGCPSGGPKGPQFWEFPVPDPKKLFRGDGQLGESGKFIKAKLEAALDDCENVRIDHVFGLLDPYVYDSTSIRYDNNGNLDWSSYRGDFISNMHDLDPNHDYHKVLEKIIIPTLKEHGIDPEKAVFEDLGHKPPNFDYMFYDKLKLHGISDVSYQRGEDLTNAGINRNWAYVGAHDSEPALAMMENSGIKNSNAWAPDYLAGYLNSDPTRIAEQKEFNKRITSDSMERIKAKFADLFLVSDKIQISFADFFGINKTYNKGGMKDKSYWKLRMNNNFEDAYYKNLSSDNPTALNLPEILKIAVRAKMDRQIISKMSSDPANAEDYRKTLNARMQPLLERLDKFANIFKEKE